LLGSGGGGSAIIGTRANFAFKQVPHNLGVFTRYGAVAFDLIENPNMYRPTKFDCRNSDALH